MFELSIGPSEVFNDDTQEFILVKPIVLRLEHSLVSMSKWESKWKKPFLDRRGHTLEETRDYIRCMTLNQNVDPYVYYALTKRDYDAISDYIGDEMTATTIRERSGRAPSRQIVTSELIYYWMTVYNIPMECQKWHLNRLLVLIRIAEIHNAPKQKMSNRDILSRNAKLNAARRKKLGTKG